MSELPRGWSLAPLMDNVDLHDSRRIPLNQTQRSECQGPYPYYGANGQVDSINDYIFDGEFILVAEDGGYFDDPARGVAYEVSGNFWVNNHAHILSPKHGIPRRYLTYALNQLDWMPYVGGSTRLKLTQEGMRRIHIPLAPPGERERIVAKLDSLLARSKSAREDLARIPRLVERYKQAILTAAFRGDLTAACRNLSTPGAAQLLAELAIGPIPGEDLPTIPPEWRWVKAGDLCAIKGGLALGKKRPSGLLLVERPYLRVANVQRGWLNLGEIKTVLVTAKEAEALRLEPGDVLMNEGGDRDKLGRGWIWEGQIPDCIHQNHVFRLRPKSASVPARYLSYYANEFGQTYFLREGKQTTNLASISMSKLSALPIPVASPEEMELIVHKIEAAFGFIDRLGAETNRATGLLDRLDQATLAKAFRGELVPQDPNDQPVSIAPKAIHTEKRRRPRRTPRSAERLGTSTAAKTTGGAMAKKRADVNETHLTEALLALGGAADAKALWQRSGMDIDEFYKQLHDEIKAGRIEEGSSKERLKLTHAA